MDSEKGPLERWAEARSSTAPYLTCPHKWHKFLVQVTSSDFSAGRRFETFNMYELLTARSRNYAGIFKLSIIP